TRSASAYSADFDPPEKQWEILERSFVLARQFGASLVRTFSFWRFPDPTAVREEVCAIIAEAARRTEAAGLKLAIENEHACNVATGAEVGWLFERIPSKAFGSLWDPGNEAAINSDPFPQGYSYVRGRVFHMHVKDWSPQQKKFVKMGTGSIDYVNQFRLMAEDGYDGILSLETHYAHPEGGKELATRESCAALRNILHEAGVKLT
ncbi:MAG TPA: sugar phosphate isomerase/epimerase, partial [Ktedonobacteraceae bacterium]|nr:sugar phosphate isomerase/epimerase [Ktedonobacteraceae bacterium]